MQTKTIQNLLNLLVLVALLALPAASASAQDPGDRPPPPESGSPGAIFKAYLPMVQNQPCAELIQNGSFEQNANWVFVPSSRPAIYTNQASHSGSRALQVGIPSASQVLDSRAEAYQDVYIPSGIAQATLRLWLYPIANITSAPEPAAQAEPALPEIGTAWAVAPLAADAQYVVVLDSNGNLLNTLVWWQTSNTQVWTYLEFDLASLAGRNVRILIGAYNNSSLGTTLMYADEVSLTSCKGTPPVSNCTNLFGNPGFESNSSWNIPATAYSAAYSTERAYSGSRSMRTGISTGTNTYSYSDAYQDVSIPSNASQASLKLWYYPQSGEVAYAPGEAEQLAPNPPQPGTLWDEVITQTAPGSGEAPLANDVQYILLLDTNGNVLKTLMWTLHNYQAWTTFTYDLMAYRGQTIRVQFGTYNDGYSGKSAMFVDQAYVDVCSGSPPPVTCSEFLTNGGFENSQAWVIPATQYTAGYSTVRYRSGVRSMRSGIVYPVDNVYSYSDFRQTISLPSSLTSAQLRVWFFPMSGESPMSPVPVMPVGPTFGDAPLANDVQYLLVLDGNGNWIDTLYWNRTNTQVWTYLTFNLAGYAGRTIQLQFGSYNDGAGGVTALYVDDASVWVCP